jgi:hypothetical protein
MLKQIAFVSIFALAVCGFTAGTMAENRNGNNGWGNGGGDGTTGGSDNGSGFGMTIDDHGNTRFHGLESGTESSPEYAR